jgi:hypothetical protein
MSIHAWRWPQLALFWLAALALALALARLQLAITGHFFWLLPYPGTVRGAVAMLGIVFRCLPLLGVGVVIVPLVAVGVTAYWVWSRLVG